MYFINYVKEFHFAISKTYKYSFTRWYVTPPTDFSNVYFLYIKGACTLDKNRPNKKLHGLVIDPTY